MNDLDSGKHLATFTTDQPIMPTAFSIIGKDVVMATQGSPNPVTFSLRQPKESQDIGKKIDMSIFETSGNNTDKFDYNPSTSPPDLNDVDDDKDDDEAQAC